MPIIELPNGKTAEFPENMSHEQISDVLRKQFPKPGLLQRAGEFAEQNINQPVERNVLAPALGFMQGITNLPSNAINLAGWGAGKLTGQNIPKFPSFDVAPHTLPAEAGNIASFFAGPGMFNAAAKIPELAGAASSVMKIPQIASAVGHAANIIKSNPLASRIAGSSLLGGVYSPDNPLLGLGLGGAAGTASSLIPHSYEKLSPYLKPFDLTATKKSITNALLNPHDALENRAIQAFDKVSDEVNNRGINRIPMTNNQGIPVVDFNNLKSYFPDIKQYKELLSEASKGDYDSLRKIQTDLYEKGKQNLGSNFEADRMKGAEMLEKRNDINQAISDHLINTGNKDLAEILHGARNDWRTLQDIYYNKNMNNAIINMVNKDFRKIPDNLVNVLQEDSIPMKNLRDFHPGLAEKVRGYQIGKNVLRYGIPASTAYLGYEYGKRK